MLKFANVGQPPEPIPIGNVVAHYIIGVDDDFYVDRDAYFLTLYETGEVWNWSFPFKLIEISVDLESFRMELSILK